MASDELYEEIEELNEQSDTQQVLPPLVDGNKKKNKKRKRDHSNEVKKPVIRVGKTESYDGTIYKDFDTDIKNKLVIGYADLESVSINETDYVWEGKNAKGIMFQINRSYDKDGVRKTFSFKITKKKLKSFFQAVEMAKKIYFEGNQF